MRFWRLTHPEYRSDYKHTFINGRLEHPFGLPGVECDVCGATWGGSGILPFVCPEALRENANIKKRWPISLSQHEALQRDVMKALGIEGKSFVDLRPGDDFQPCFLDVASRPRADFLWSSIGSLVVSERIKDALVRHWQDDVVVCPVNLRKIGKRDARLAPLTPSTGEPADMIDEAPLRKDTFGTGPYFEILVQKECGYPPGGEPTSICAGCGRPDVDGEKRQLVMTPSMWQGDNVFFLATTLWVIVTDDVRRKLSALHPTNVVFREMREG